MVFETLRKRLALDSQQPEPIDQDEVSADIPDSISQLSEGQAIGYSQMRRIDIGKELLESSIRYAAENPLPELEPEIIDGNFEEPSE